jgi:hypothetical protein
MQHSPPLCVLQQQSTATFHRSVIGTSCAARGTRQRAARCPQLEVGSALTADTFARISARAITKIMAMCPLQWDSTSPELRLCISSQEKIGRARSWEARCATIENAHACLVQPRTAPTCRSEGNPLTKASALAGIVGGTVSSKLPIREKPGQIQSAVDKPRNPGQPNVSLAVD